MANLATMRQGRELLAIFDDVPAEQMQGISQALLHLVREYAIQAPEVRKPLTLKTVRQVLGLPPLAQDIWITVDWKEVQPTQRFEAVVIRQPAKPRRTRLVRLRPTDVGLANDAHPSEVIDLVTSWGYQSVPRGALDVLLRYPPPLRGHYHGYAIVPLGSGQYAYLCIDPDGLKEADGMAFNSPNFTTTWSVIMAC